MKDNDMKCVVQCSLCQDWVHLKCFVMAAGLDEAVFQGTKVDPTKKKKVKRSVNEVGLSRRINKISLRLCAVCYSDLQALSKWRRCQEDYHQVI